MHSQAQFSTLGVSGAFPGAFFLIFMLFALRWSVCFFTDVGLRGAFGVVQVGTGLRQPQGGVFNDVG